MNQALFIALLNSTVTARAENLFALSNVRSADCPPRQDVAVEVVWANHFLNACIAVVFDECFTHKCSIMQQTQTLPFGVGAHLRVRPDREAFVS